MTAELDYWLSVLGDIQDFGEALANRTQSEPINSSARAAARRAGACADSLLELQPLLDEDQALYREPPPEVELIDLGGCIDQLAARKASGGG